MPSPWAPALGKRNYAESQANALGNVSPLPSASWRHSAKSELCRVPGGGTRQRLNAVSSTDGRRTAGACGHARRLCRVPPGQHSAKVTRCRVLLFADGRHSANPGHAVCRFFAEYPRPGTRQTTSLPSACGLTLGKGLDTWQIVVFR